MRPVRLHPVALAVLLLTGALIAGSVTEPGWRRARAEQESLEFGAYLQRPDGRTADPVNLIFTGERDAVALAVTLTTILRWAPVRGGDMSFVERGSLRWAEVQLGNNQPGGAREHMRLTGAVEESQRWGPYTLGAVHRDLPVACGHVGTAFDSERDAVVERLREAGFAVRWVWLGNTGAVEHCNDTTTRGDGWAAVIEVPRRTPPSPSPSPTASPTPAPAPSPTPSPSPSPSPTPTPAATRAPATPSPMPLPHDNPEPAPPVR